MLQAELNRQGFATAAFVSSIVLSRQSGLARGFDTYSDHFDVGADDERMVHGGARLAGTTDATETVGGGAQVGQVAIGAISEADRHNIRGEPISVDTIPLVGEGPLAEAVRAVVRLPRARALVLAGALMGGEIERAVREVRAQGLLVISLNMAGSVPEAADLVVSDPVQAGVMAVMAVADTAKFTVDRLKRRVF